MVRVAAKGEAAAESHRQAISRRLRASDGITIATDSIGDADAPAVVFAHGFGQTRHAWTTTATDVANKGWRSITADARGHGDSGWRDDGAYDFQQFVDDLVLVARDAREPVLIGASMGGLLGLIAQSQARPFRAIVLVDVTPRWESAGVERIIGFMRAYPTGFASVEEASAAVANYLTHRAEKKSPERLRQLLVARDDGRLRWHWDPRLLDRVAADSEKHQAALLDAARQIDVPTLLISGEKSDIVSDATISEFLRLVPHARHVRVPRATHMVAGDENDAFSSAVMDFLETLQPLGKKDRLS